MSRDVQRSVLTCDETLFRSTSSKALIGFDEVRREATSRDAMMFFVMFPASVFKSVGRLSRHSIVVRCFLVECGEVMRRAVP